MSGPEDEDEATPLLVQSRNGEGHIVKSSLLRCLYVSHFLSTWNMRSYEFAAILLFASAYPNTLLPTSIRGVLTNSATLLLSPAIGNWVDRNASKFHPIKKTILVQRVCIVVACALWISLFLSTASHARPAEDNNPGPLGWITGRFSKTLLVAIIILCSIIERICAVGNQFVMERDWIPTIASERSKPPLHHLNAVMRRIDLISKMLAPVFVSAIAEKTDSVVLAAVTAGLNMTTVGIELITARNAWNHCAVLQGERGSQPDAVASGVESDCEDANRPQVEKNSLALYFGTDVCLASLSAALQSFSVLTLSGPMTTYLLSRHYSISLITSARTVISIVEISSTMIFPIAASFLAKYPSSLIPDPIAATGFSGVSTQVAFTIPCFIAIVLVPMGATDPASTSPLLTACIFVFLGCSGLGYWIHNVAVQQIVQTRVPAARRVEFAGVETTFVSAAEIGRWASSAVWSRPKQFGGVAAGGLACVVVCWVLFTVWVWRLRRKIILNPR